MPPHVYLYASVFVSVAGLGFCSNFLLLSFSLSLVCVFFFFVERHFKLLLV